MDFSNKTLQYVNIYIFLKILCFGSFLKVTSVEVQVKINNLAPLRRIFHRKSQGCSKTLTIEILTS